MARCGSGRPAQGLRGAYNLHSWHAVFPRAERKNRMLGLEKRLAASTLSRRSHALSADEAGRQTKRHCDAV